MSISQTGKRVPETTGAATARRRGNRRILKLVIGAAALLTAGSIAVGLVGKVQDAADRTH